MYYNNEDLQKHFEKIAEGRTPEQFLEQTVKNILSVWLSTEKGRGEYKRTGGFWEVLHPMLSKYEPELLSKYENILGEEFNYFNPKVKEFFEQGSDLYNLLGALQYMNTQENNYSQQEDIHYIELGDDEILPYIPNQNINSNQHFGRENE